MILVTQLAGFRGKATQALRVNALLQHRTLYVHVSTINSSVKRAALSPIFGKLSEVGRVRSSGEISTLRAPRTAH